MQEMKPHLMLHPGWHRHRTVGGSCQNKGRNCKVRSLSSSRYQSKTQNLQEGSIERVNCHHESPSSTAVHVWLECMISVSNISVRSSSPSTPICRLAGCRWPLPGVFAGLGPGGLGGHCQESSPEVATRVAPWTWAAGLGSHLLEVLPGAWAHGPGNSDLPSARPQ